MRSLPNILVLLLIALVAAPLDTAAASWMALGMDSHASHDMAMDSTGHPGHQHTRADATGQEGADASSSDDDCDEHCMNCSSHCFTSVVVAASALLFPDDGKLSANLSFSALHRASLLYRPPITG